MSSRKHLITGLSVVLCGALILPASAMMPPYVYEDARTNAADIVVIEVQSVTTPITFGECEVRGVVHGVERGTRYEVGNPITLAVDCLTDWGSEGPITGGTIWQDSEEMKSSAYGRAFLDETGAVSYSQYEQLSDSEL